MPLTVDPNVLDLAKAGDPTALDDLIRACWPQAYRISFGMLGDRGLAEDAAQEASSLIAIHIRNLRDTSAFAAWFYRLVTRSAISVARQQKPTFPLRDATHVGYSSDFDGLDILDAVSRLPLTQRAPVILKYYVGLKSGEIAAILKISAALVRFRLMLARRALRLQFSDPGTCKGTVTDV